MNDDNVTTRQADAVEKETLSRGCGDTKCYYQGMCSEVAPCFVPKPKYGLASVEWILNGSTNCTICAYREECRTSEGDVYPCCKVCKHYFIEGECWKETHGGGCNKAFIKFTDMEDK